MWFHYVAVLALCNDVFAGVIQHAERVEVRQIERRDDTTTTTTDPGATTTTGGTDTGTFTGTDASVTLYQGTKKQFGITPLVSPPTPSSGCVLASQTLTTWTEIWTFPLITTTSFETDIATFTDGLYCLCASGMMAGTITSFNPEGTEYIFCATGGTLMPADTPTGAIGTSNPQASAKPGDVNNPDWADVSCDIPSIQNVGGVQDPAKMWNDSGCDAAWNDMMGAWEKDQYTTYFGFSDYLVNYFHGPAGTRCDIVGAGTCDGQVNCGTHLAPNGNVNSPAGYMILATMEGLHTMLEAINTAVGNAGGTIDAGAFTGAFSPIVDELAYAEHVKLILDIVLVVVAVALVFAVEAILPELPAVAAAAETEGVTEVTATNTFSTIKTQFYLNFGAALGFAKDRLPAPDLPTATYQVEQYLDGILRTLGSGVNLTTQNVFDTPDSLKGLINNAAYWQPKGNSKLSVGSSFPIEQRIQQVIWASALPMVWSTGTQGGIAWIMTSAGLFYSGDTKPTGCDNWAPGDTISSDDPYSDAPPWYIKSDDSINQYTLFQDTFFCVNNVPYWLVLGYNDHYTLTLNVPKGLDQLDGTQWGGTTPQQLIQSATLAWSNNGNKNTVATAFNATDVNGLQTLSDSKSVGDIPGIVALPVCSMQQAADTSHADLSNSANNPFWPCPSGTVTGVGDGS